MAKKKVSETFTTALVSDGSPCLFSNKQHTYLPDQVGCFCQKFKPGDKVRVTVELLERRKERA